MSPALALPTILFMALLGSGIMIYLWLIAKTKEQQVAAAALSCIVYVIFCPHVYFYDALILTIPLLLTMKRVSLFSAFLEQPLSLRLWAVLLLVFPALIWIPYLTDPILADRVTLVCAMILLISGLKARILDPNAA